ncbi:BTB/POZ and MATH domain-containing protein 3-like [Papaver somniferum]|nr:BTB/POZ and MATH domain-containing protein 3-like [Papaver somniferum]
MVFYPDGFDKASKEYVSLFIKLVGSLGEVRALYGFELLDKTGKGKYGVYGYRDESPTTFKSGSTWGYPKFMKRFAVETYLKDDCLSIHCTVGVVQTRVEEGKRCVIPVPPSDMIQNLKGLLESGVGSDITFQAMLLFLYSDELPKAHEFSDSDSVCTLTTLMQHLLAAADRFDISRLKLMCEAKLCEDIDADTVADSLSLTERYQCQELKTVCLNFAAKPENLGEVMKSDGYSHVEKWCPSLLTDFLKKCMRL